MNNFCRMHPLPDATLSPSGITYSSASPIEADILTVTASISNAAGIDSSGMVASFFADAPGRGQTYLGSAFVPAIPASGTAQTAIRWDTTGFTGSVPVRVVLDPYNRVAEASETNNVVTTTITIRTRPDLRVLSWTQSDEEPAAGEPISVTLVVENGGQTNAPSSATGLYLSNPDAGGALLASQSAAITGSAVATLT